MEESEQSDPARIYEEYLGRTIADPWTRILLEYASLGSGEQVLDLACGTGSVARQVAPIVGERGKVSALDINPGMLAVARSLDPPDGATIEWLQGDALALQFPDALSISCCASRDCSSSPIGRVGFAKCAGCSLLGEGPPSASGSRWTATPCTNRCSGRPCGT